MTGYLERLLADSAATKTGCLERQGSVDAGGYGQVQLGERTRTGTRKPSKVHRVGFKLLAGPLPNWMPLDHACRNRRCWLPGFGHVHPVTPRSNTVENSDDLPALYVRRLECFYGHDLRVPDAYYFRPDGKGRMCRRCLEERGRWRRGDRRPLHYKAARDIQKAAEETTQKVPF